MTGNAAGQTVWLASYPKSGNTWLRAVYTALLTDADVDVNALAGGEIPAVRDLLDDVLGLSTSDLTAAELDALRPLVDEAVDAASDGVRLRKVHDAFHLGPTGEPIVSVAAARGAVYVVRDPRDVAVSLANHTGKSLAHVVETMCRQGARLAGSRDGVNGQAPQRIDTWSAHVRSWLDQTLIPVHVVRYEDAVRDAVATFGAALRFAGFDASDGEVAAAVARASFANLAGQEAAHGFRERRHGTFFRRGVAGSWRDELPAALADRLVGAHREVMADLGYLPTGVYVG
jgi:aryl sulfotransferase